MGRNKSAATKNDANATPVPCARGRLNAKTEGRDSQAAKGPDLSAPVVRGLRAAKCAVPAQHRQAQQVPIRPARQRLQRPQRVPPAEHRHSNTTHTEACGGCPMQFRRAYCRLQQQWHCRYRPSPRAGLPVPQWQPPWRAQTTPGPNGPACGIGAGIATTCGRLSSKGTNPRELQVHQCLTHVKDCPIQ